MKAQELKLLKTHKTEKTQVTHFEN